MNDDGDALRRRLTAALDDPTGALAATGPDERRVALAAYAAAERDDAARTEVLRTALDDTDPTVRRDAAEAAGRRPACARALVDRLTALLRAHGPGTDDESGRTTQATVDAAVREAAAFALGESDVDDAADVLVSALDTERSPLVRESIAAALGALGRPHTLAAVLSLTTGEKPAVRRRAVIALAAFDDPDADAAIARALEDRDRFVREAAEWLSR